MSYLVYYALTQAMLLPLLWLWLSAILRYVGTGDHDRRLALVRVGRVLAAISFVPVAREIVFLPLVAGTVMAAAAGLIEHVRGER